MPTVRELYAHVMAGNPFPKTTPTRRATYQPAVSKTRYDVIRAMTVDDYQPVFSPIETFEEYEVAMTVLRAGRDVDDLAKIAAESENFA